ncbi:MAG: methyltransferase domain-containing protein [Actinobacteria bacterium]|nr:methyltransferase domain-containing protein [Actinomycetota bacterium]
MTAATSAQRPRRADVAASYDVGVDAYAKLWSPVIQPPGRAVIAALGIEAAQRVIDIGTGTGALVPSIRAAANGVSVIGLDPAGEMLRAARNSMTLAAVQGDAVSLPFRDAAIDRALLAFVLFHLSDPYLALSEVARVLIAGGRVGTVTWVGDDTIRAYEELDAILNEAGAPQFPTRRVDTGLDTPEAIDALFSHSGLRATRIWTEALHHQWNRSTYWALASGFGVNSVRLQRLDPAARKEVRERARQRLDALPPDAFAWSGQVLCAVATKPLSRSEQGGPR